MLKRVCLGVALLAGVPLWAQSAPATDPSQNAPSTDTSQSPDASQTPSGTETPMELPPPVTGQVYPSQVGSDVRQNYIGLGASGSWGWVDNVLPGYATPTTSSAIYTLSPSISFDKKSTRTTAQLRYTPGFTFYTQASALNETDHNASGMFEYRVTPHFVLRGQDFFDKSSNIFGPSLTLGGPVTGSLPLQVESVLAQFADRITNTATVDLGLQVSENTLIGAEGSFAELDYPNVAQVEGSFNNSNSIGASGFYTHRVSPHQYLGFIYQYMQILDYGVGYEGEASLNTFSPFYSFYLLRTRQGSLTASLQGGLEHYTFVVRGGPYLRDWTPVATASIGWQGPVTNFAVSYTREVTGGGGLNGVFTQDGETGLAQWKVARNWNLAAGGSYMKLANDSLAYTSGFTSGHTVYGSASVGRTIGRNTHVEAGYMRVQQSYSGIAAIAANPNSDRVYASVSYQFSRPVGR